MHYKKFLPLFLLVIGLWGCLKDPHTIPINQRQRAKFSISDAEAVYNKTRQALTRANESGESMYCGELSLWWEGAEYSENIEISGYDVEMLSERAFYQVQTKTNCDSIYFARPLYPRLVVVKSNDDSTAPSSYIVFYFSDLRPDENYEQDASEGLLNCTPKEGFTGRVVYTTLLGVPVAISKHVEGKQVDQSFLGNITDSLQFMQEAERFNRIASGLKYIVEEECETRATYWGGVILPVEIVVRPADWPINITVIEDSTPEEGDDKFDQTENDDVDDMATPPTIGTGDSDIPDDDSEYPANPNIEIEDEELLPLMDSLLKDCMGEKLIKGIDVGVKLGLCDTLSGANYNHGTKIGTVYMKPEHLAHDYVLLEELIHIHQQSIVESSVYKASKLNFEIAAKVCWLVREKQNKKDDFNIFDYEKTLGGTHGASGFMCLINSFPLINEDVYISIIEEYRDSKSSYKDYLESVDSRNYLDLYDIVKDCLENENN